MNDRAVDVLIVTYNSAATIGRCLASIPEEAAGWPVRIHVWDNASGDGTEKALLGAAEQRDGIAVHLSERNLGFPAACNRLLLASDGDVVFFLNPDVELRPGVLALLVETVEDPEVGLATCRLETDDGRPQPEAARRQPSLARVVLGGLGGGAVRRLVPSKDALVVDRDVDCAMGALLAARREVMDRLGGLDASIFMYLEDIDLCRRVRNAGLRIRYLGTVGARHQSGASRRGMERFLDTLGPVIWVTYFSRYGSRLERLALRPALALMYGGRAASALVCLRPRSARVWLGNARRALHVRPASPRRNSVSSPRLPEEALV